MATGKQQALVLGRLKRRLEEHFEKVKRKEALWPSRSGEPDAGWYEAYRQEQVAACKIDDLIFEAVMAGATKAGVGRVVGKSGEAISHVVTKVAARRYFALLRGKKRGAGPMLRVVGE